MERSYSGLPTIRSLGALIYHYHGDFSSSQYPWVLRIIPSRIIISSKLAPMSSRHLPLPSLCTHQERFISVSYRPYPAGANHLQLVLHVVVGLSSYSCSIAGQCCQQKIVQTSAHDDLSPAVGHMEWWSAAPGDAMLRSPACAPSRPSLPVLKLFRWGSRVCAFDNKPKLN
eukprot:10334270-Heterocapsa_arctica.AAC.1